LSEDQPTRSLDSFIWLFFRLDGRIGRWTFFLAFLFLAVLQGLALYRYAITPQDTGQSAFWATAFWTLAISSMWCTLALGVKRLHDFGKPGILALTLFIPVVLLFAFLLLCLWPGDPGPNRYGDFTDGRGRKDRG